MLVTISKPHFGAGCVNQGKRGSIKGSLRNLWEEAKQTLPEKMTTRWGTWGGGRGVREYRSVDAWGEETGMPPAQDTPDALDLWPYTLRCQLTGQEPHNQEQPEPFPKKLHEAEILTDASTQEIVDLCNFDFQLYPNTHINMTIADIIL